MRILKRILKEEGGRCSAATQCHSKRGAEVTARFSDPIIIVPLSLLLSSPHVRPFLLFNPSPPTHLSHPLHSPLLSLPSHILPPLLPLSSVIFLPLVPLACLCCSR